MSAPRIKTKVFAAQAGGWTRHRYWSCTGCKPFHFGGPGEIETDLAAAADAGRAHLAQFHTAQMPASTRWDSHAAPRSACGCRSDKSPADVARGPQIAAQPFGDDFPCCTTPMQRAHTHSREDC